MSPSILFLIFSLVYLAAGTFYRDTGGSTFIAIAGFMAIFSGIYWLFKKGKQPLSSGPGYVHAVFTAVGMYLLSSVTTAIIAMYTKGSPDVVAFGADNIIISQLSAGVILFLLGQIVFIIAIIKALGRARQQKQI